MKRLFALLAGLVVVFSGAVAVSALNASEPSEVGLPADMEVDDVLREFESDGLESAEATVAELAPRPIWSDELRDNWLNAWNDMRDCVASEGMLDAVMEAPPTLGDGQTPIPAIIGGGAELEAALEHCPFDLSNVDLDELTASMVEASGAAVSDADDLPEGATPRPPLEIPPGG